MTIATVAIGEEVTAAKINELVTSANTNLPASNRTNWVTNNAGNEVVGQIGWKSFGNWHTIFDASAGTSPDGNAISNTTPIVSWASTLPTLMGWNGTNTYGVRVDISRISESCSGAAKNLAGAPAFTNGTDGWFRSTGDAGWFNSDYSVGIYATEPGNVRTYNGANFIAAGNVTAYSDERLKKDWTPVQENFVSKLAKIQNGSYTRIDTGARQTGVSAQSLKTLLPEAVMEDTLGEKMLSVAYGNAALVACVELAKEIQMLKAEIASLKGAV